MKKIAMISAIALLAAGCSQTGAPVPFSVIPTPNRVTLQEGSYNIKGATFSVDPAADALTREAVEALAGQLSLVTGKASIVVEGPADVQFHVQLELAAEEYTLSVTTAGIHVAASTYNGFLYAIQTLKQMLPAAVYGTAPAKADWLLPCAEIQDAPRFAYRGQHLDCSRHFFSVDEVKKYLDIMAVYKLNRLHWHLTDDQGWRVEIKAYPRLTEVSAYRDGTVIEKQWGTNDGIRYGGYYTQDELRDVVAYAARLGITVIPEVDLPGHMVAALAAYPELGCTGGPYAVWTRWGVAKDILCAGNDDVYTFLENVFTEIMDIFPSEYIHIGGDECFDGDAERDRPDPWEVCPKCQAKMRQLGLRDRPGHSKKQLLQGYVTGRMQKFLAAHGRKMIGWDEILEGELMPGATVMSWRGTKGGIAAASKGFDVIMTPSTYLYIDQYQSRERDKEPFAIGGFCPVDRVYGYEPYDGVPAEATHHILGAQANLWTEYVTSPEHLEYMLLPRLAALSEVQWCQADRKDYDRFRAALEHSREIYDVMGYTYCKDAWGLIGLPGHEQPARTEEELEAYRLDHPQQWIW